ncbi:OmpA family protein [Shinella curvata]|uniref:OmpA family protein n=1 Tax=Shinella curvata TaxID=1817964 RepID=A0ABT8X8H2_9HYPH|nr:OmpA family protein [Shinella curvata]MCJ8052125.1 OmpA family protein [Shinella curvata]MDO6119927.1 OmpA family protein [Shinella curvata]
MTFRSRLFATVALPLLSASLIATPTLADARLKSLEIAQASDEGQPSEDELLKQQQEEQQRAEQEEQQRQADEQKAAEDQQRQADEQKAAEDQQRQAEEQKAAEDQQRQADEQKAAEDQQRQAEEQKAAEDQQRQAEEQKAAEDQQRQADEQKAAEDQQRQAEEQKAAEDQQRQAEEQKAAEDQQRQADEQKAAEDQQRQAEEQKAAEDQQRQADEQKAAEDQQRQADERKAAEDQQQSEQPMADESQQAGEETPAAEPVPEVVETLTEEQKQEIAQDPGKTDETVVLPVENGAAVLDSDKDADNAGGQESRDNRRKQREEQRAQEEEVPVPDTDDSAQATISEEVREAVPQRIEAAINEEGKRVDEAPEFIVPETTNIVNNTVINNTTIVNNNNTIDNSVTQVNVIERVENRTVLEVGDQLIVRGDDRPRLRRDSEEVFYDNLARGRVRETIQRPGGVRIVTIYNRYGDIIQRSRVGRDGREYILVYAPELEEDAPRPGLVDVGYELPPMRLRIPVSDYIIDTSSDPDRDYYEFLAEPPVERVERVYTIDEVKHSARLRDKVRRIDLDTITFATASAEVPMSQARTLRSVADAMQKVLDKDPGETFLIEGHTDAVGTDKSNLVLSDERAESVASLLTEVYGIPPENLQTQGYGERFLKVRTEAAEQQNRRVTIRRVTTLVRPLAKAN